jgi:putative pyoverdin transport system ATP-binding/permease protein
MPLSNVLNDPLLRRLFPALRFAVLTAILDIATLATLYAALRHTETRSTDRYFLLFLFLMIIYMWVYHKLNQDIIQTVQEYIAAIRLKVMNRLRKTNVYALEKIGVEPIYTALTLDVQTASDAAHLMTDTIWASSVIISGLGYLAILSWQAFAVAIAILGIVSVFYGYNQIVTKRVLEQARQRENKLFEAFAHLLDGCKELRLNDRKSRAFFQTALQPNVNELRQMNLRVARNFMQTDTLVYGFWKGLMMAVILFLPELGVSSRHILIGSLGIILYLPIDVLMEEIPHLFLANVSLKRLYAFEQTLEQVEQEDWDQAAAFVHIPFTTLRYDQMTFTYEATTALPFTLGPLSLAFRPGEIVFITGGNGSGKTTLLKVLTGLYAATSGRMFLNDQAIAATQHRHLFASVFTDFHLFDRVYGRPDLDPANVQALLARVRLDAKVQFVDGRFSTLDLSTGQKKRLALVAAMIEDRPIYVLDEWAAEQDPQFRRDFYETLLPEFKAQGKTVVLVTHDDRYFHVADRIITMEDGHITEESRHPVL